MPTPRNPERAALRRKGMIGFVALPPDGAWNGRIHTTLHTARCSAPEPADVLLVRTDGALFLQVDGNPTAPLLDDATPPRNRRIDLRQRRALRRRATSPRTSQPSS